MQSRKKTNKEDLITKPNLFIYLSDLSLSEEKSNSSSITNTNLLSIKEIAPNTTINTNLLMSTPSETPSMIESLKIRSTENPIQNINKDKKAIIQRTTKDISSSILNFAFNKDINSKRINTLSLIRNNPTERSKNLES